MEVLTRMPSSGFSCRSLNSFTTLLTMVGERPAPVCEGAKQCLSRTLLKAAFDGVFEDPGQMGGDEL